VFDPWVQAWRRKHAQGDMIVVRFADEIVMGFQRKSEAERYLTHPITNATSESINAKIRWVKYTARGFRNKQNFINAIYFHGGGLDLAPGTH
jgi:transposase